VSAADFDTWCRLPTLILGVGCRLYFFVSAAPIPVGVIAELQNQYTKATQE
jgi:hypothetical protein